MIVLRSVSFKEEHWHGEVTERQRRKQGKYSFPMRYRRRRGGEKGQAAVEFAMVFGLFLATVIAVIEAGLFWATEEMGAAHATEVGSQVAATVNSQSLLSVYALNTADAAVYKELEAAMIGTPVTCEVSGEVAQSPCIQADSCPLGQDCGGAQACPTTPLLVYTLFNNTDHIVLCSETDGTFASVVVVGYTSMAFGVNIFGPIQGIPIDVEATVKILNFQP